MGGGEDEAVGVDDDSAPLAEPCLDGDHGAGDSGSDEVGAGALVGRESLEGTTPEGVLGAPG